MGRLPLDHIASRYNELARSGKFPDDTYLHRSFQATINNCLDLKPPLKILDAGGGAGFFGLQLARRGNKVNILDISIDSLLVAQDRSIRQDCNKNISINAGDVESLPFIDECFNLVLCIFVFSHLNDPYKAICELNRVTRNGGGLILSFENRLWHVVAAGLGEQYEEALNLASSIRPLVKAYGILPPVRLYSMPEIEDICSAGRLRISRFFGFRYITSFQESLKGIGTTDAERLMHNDDDALKLENILIDNSELLCLARHYLVFCDKI